ncbi:hypothetical protein RF11_12038 [Thelohanellus kitauei]|uniref:Uncharacterized protein n=1 Tax=Thelohanellus kitauei TaxID=669202 RepID=A0A0C2JHI7_THEKT|nr:hypothetical protein RF11_12038 [Thelohanellus kitauei]
MRLEIYSLLMSLNKLMKRQFFSTGLAGKGEETDKCLTVSETKMSTSGNRRQVYISLYISRSRYKALVNSLTVGTTTAQPNLGPDHCRVWINVLNRLFYGSKSA